MTVSQSSKPERDPAEVYDELFVPALFAQWGPLLPKPQQSSPDRTCST